MKEILWREEQRLEKSGTAGKEGTLPRQLLNGVSGAAGSNEPLLDAKVSQNLRLLLINNERVVAC